MAIYDNNGTTNAEIGKLYDNNGTTNSQIGKVYDNNGTTNSLIYSAVTPITIVPNTTTYPASKWTTKVEDYKITVSGSVSASGAAMTYSMYQYRIGMYYVPIACDGHTSLTIASNITLKHKYGGRNIYFYVGLASSIPSAIEGIGDITSVAQASVYCDGNGTYQLNKTVTFAEQTGTRYFYMAVFDQTGSSDTYGTATVTSAILN